MSKITPCVLPWISMHIDVDGSVGPCCLFSGPKINIEQIDSIDSWAKSETMIELRKTFNDGVWPAGCEQCEQLSKQGRVSKKDSDGRFFNDVYGSIDLTEPKIRYAQVKLLWFFA